MEQLWAQVCQTKITMSASKCRLLPLDFITTSALTSDTTLHSDRQPARVAGLVARELMLSSGPRHSEHLGRRSEVPVMVQLRRPTRPHAVAKRSRLRHRRHAC